MTLSCFVCQLYTAVHFMNAVYVDHLPTACVLEVINGSFQLLWRCVQDDSPLTADLHIVSATHS
jgi:hypothetical protein